MTPELVHLCFQMSTLFPSPISQSPCLRRKSLSWSRLPHPHEDALLLFILRKESLGKYSAFKDLTHIEFGFSKTLQACFANRVVFMSSKSLKLIPPIDFALKSTYLPIFAFLLGFIQFCLLIFVVHLFLFFFVQKTGD